MRRRSAAIDGRAIFGCPISSRCSSVRRAAEGAPISGRIGIGSCPGGALVAYRGWKRRFDDPIPLPRGRHLITLEDAGNYITRLPKAEHEAHEWQAAMESLILVVQLGGPNDVRADWSAARAQSQGRARVQS